MRYIFALMLVSLWLNSTAPAVSPTQGEPPDQPCRVRRIYVAGLGDSEGAERFRRELQRQLKNRRFTLATKAEEAEGVLTGKFSFTGSDSEGTVAVDPTELRDQTGARLWHGNFYFTRKGRMSLLSGGNIKDAARKVAANLRGACQ
jgi:hypothetical protein